MITEKDMDRIIGTLILEPKYKFIDKALLAEIVKDTVEQINDLNF